MLWQLFWTFLEIGAVSFGGGYGMISLIREKVLLHGWLEETQFLSFIAVSESTPGPLAINMATFIGASQAGTAGAICATLGVVLPSFFIILLIAALIHNLLQYAGVNAFLSGIRPCVVALILATAVTMGLSSLLGVSTLADTPRPCLARHRHSGGPAVAPFWLAEVERQSSLPHCDDPSLRGAGHGGLSLKILDFFNCGRLA